MKDKPQTRLPYGGQVYIDKLCLALHRCVSCVLCLFLVVGCGYQPVKHIPNTTTIAIPIFENRTLRRGHEFELTNIVHRQVLAQTPFQIVNRPDKADLVLTGEIVGYTKPVLIESREDEIIESQVIITLKVLLKDQHTGRIIYEGQKTGRAELITARDESEASARVQIYEKLAQWVVSLLESGPK